MHRARKLQKIDHVSISSCLSVCLDSVLIPFNVRKTFLNHIFRQKIFPILENAFGWVRTRSSLLKRHVFLTTDPALVISPFG